MRIVIAFLVAFFVAIAVVVWWQRVHPAESHADAVDGEQADDPRDQTQLHRISERTFIHEPTRISFTLPDGWNDLGPQRLERKIEQRPNSVLRVEWPARGATATLTWIQLQPQEKASNWVRDTPIAGEYGEEYETLKATYGVSWVTRPLRIAHPTLVVYRLDYSVPPSSKDASDGVLLLIPRDVEDTTWLLKVRISYPKSDRGRRDEYVRRLLSGVEYQPT